MRSFFLFIYIYIYIYIYICNHENNMPSRISPQRLCGKCMSCDIAIVVITGRAHCFHDCIYIIYYTHLASVRFEHSVYIYIYIPLLLLFSYIFDRRGKLKSHLWKRLLIAVLEKDVLKNP